MKITFVSPSPNLSGGQRVTAIYADRLAMLGHDVTVVAQARKVKSPRARVLALLRGRGTASPIKKSHYDHMTAAKYELISEPGPVRAKDVPDSDVVIATWWETAFMVAHFPPSKGQKVYFVQHHEVFAHLPDHLSAASYLLPLKKITIAMWLKDTLRDLYGDADVALVPNAVDHKLFYASGRAKQNTPTIGLMYSLSPFKGVDIALAAIARVKKRYPDLRVLAFGAVPPKRRMPLPAGTEFHLRPERSVLRELYARCDAFVIASRLEGFGLPVLEAMACHTPVVATRAGCAPDVIDNGVNGFLADIDDPDGLAAGIEQVLSLDPDAWTSISEAAVNSVLSYTWDDATALFEAELTKVVQGETQPQ